MLDNCEHVLGAAGSVVSALLGSARGVRVLATSREWLRVTGEQAFPVPPLAVPGVDSSDDGRALDHGVAEYEAVTLLEERAVAVLPGFRVDRDNEEAVARLCRRLDGLPLAIELAAVRLRMLSLEQILQRIEDRFRLLTTKHRGALARHQTLRAAVEWSFGLCSRPSRCCGLGCRCSRVSSISRRPSRCVPVLGLAEEDILDAVSGLVEKSVVSPVQRGTTMWYRMLETIRQYGREQLAVRGEEALLRRRHRDYYLAGVSPLVRS